MSQSPEDSATDHGEHLASELHRLPCPQCETPTPMKFIFPTPREDPCEELNAWRFQVCQFCGWTGDVTTRSRYEIESWPLGGYWINGRFYRTLRLFLEETERC